jgi:hypothetical protein
MKATWPWGFVFAHAELPTLHDEEGRIRSTDINIIFRP